MLHFVMIVLAKEKADLPEVESRFVGRRTQQRLTNNDLVFHIYLPLSKL